MNSLQIVSCASASCEAFEAYWGLIELFDLVANRHCSKRPQNKQIGGPKTNGATDEP